MKVASWNINSLRRRLERSLAWLADKQPDVVCLQETKCSDDQFPEMALRTAGYHAVFHGQKSYNGVALLAREDFSEPEIALSDDAIDPQARVIAATVRGVRVLSIYAPNGQAVGSEAFAYKLQWFDRLGVHLARTRARFENVLVCGDFNVAPEDRDTHDADLWRGAIMCSEAERAGYASLLQLGFRDTLRLHHAEGGIFSWWDYRMLAFPKNRGLRIDEILASEKMAARCLDAGVDREMRKGAEPSDHAPVWAEFSE
ncbi:MAG: exodeoxyribonuclease III [Verrucomicrobiota bacterium]|nr:exodeoxyribonuclease III [Verrucomicrobiota bacterium]